MNKLRPTPKEVIWIAILFGWTIFNITLYSSAEPTYMTAKGFWPFDKYCSVDSYNITEFIAFALVPWVMFVVYYFLIRVAAQPKKP